MPRIERKHEVLSVRLDDDLLRTKSRDGWRAVSVVWERTVEGEVEEPVNEAVPYGLRVGADCQTLEPDASELRMMLYMLKGIVEDRPFGTIAKELNAAGHKTRTGAEWNQTTVFHMLPRLIEVAPGIFNSDDWRATKPHLTL
ncbi:MAG: hypothetical protein GKS06_08930 [Acidobacteria bacterium]|nr:hypothetical protein [Acidobacteriota bacterium]